MSEQTLDELKKDIISAAAMIMFCTAIDGLVAMLHGWM